MSRQKVAPTPTDYQRVAESIAKVSDAAKALRSSGLSRKAVEVLISHQTKIPQRDVRLVLEGAEDLAKWCLEQPR